MAAYDGGNIFGFCKSCKHLPNPSVAQVNEFFGVNGTHSLFGGTRGRIFQITGCFVGSNRGECLDAEAVLLSYIDGIPRTLVDNFGRSYPNVVFDGEYDPDEAGPRPSVLGGTPCWTLGYKCQFRGLT